jgi:hypothetical protein
MSAGNYFGQLPDEGGERGLASGVVWGDLLYRLAMRDDRLLIV